MKSVWSPMSYPSKVHYLQGDNEVAYSFCNIGFTFDTAMLYPTIADSYYRLKQELKSTPLDDRYYKINCEDWDSKWDRIKVYHFVIPRHYLVAVANKTLSENEFLIMVERGDFSKPIMQQSVTIEA